MFRRLISSLRSRLGSSSEPDIPDPSIDIEAVIEKARLRDQQLRNRAARAIADKVVLVSRIRESAAAEEVNEETFTSWLDRYREAWDEAETSKDAIGENVAELVEIKTQHPAFTDVVDTVTRVMSTSIEDETPSPESLEGLVGRPEREASGEGGQQQTSNLSMEA